jgi:hypothetical protein
MPLAWESILTKPFKYLVRGLIVDVGILCIASIYLLVSIALNYKGRCGLFWFFGGQGRPCPFLEYMRGELFFLVASLFPLWWLILLALAVIPGIGYLIGLYCNRLNSN